MSWAPSPKPPTKAEIAFYRFMRGIMVGVSRVYLPGPVIGRENLPRSGPYIVAPVHRSYVDWLLVARITTRRLRYIVKAEIWKSKLVGRTLEILGCFPVNRSGADRDALERCRAVLVGGEPLVIFPEGTRRSGPVVEDLREGVAYLALRAGVPVVPIGIGGSEKAMPRGSSLPRPRRVHVVIGKPISPEEAQPSLTGQATRVSRKATKLFSDRVGAGIQAVFDEAERLATHGSASGPRPDSF
ncbi:MAG: lysophospholipid acyltransferase family protein [Acidimicrobiales bacterium]